MVYERFPVALKYTKMYIKNIQSYMKNKSSSVLPFDARPVPSTTSVRPSVVRHVVATVVDYWAGIGLHANLDATKHARCPHHANQFQEPEQA